MITYTWNINQLECSPSEDGLQNVVKVIHWILTGVDDNGVSASISNSYPLLQLDPQNFIDYTSLTEEIVIGWLENSLDVSYLHQKLSDDISFQYTPLVVLPPPWE